jgi:dipeptidyl aminopeptidase/acylaminoacyl peptidase
MTPSRLTPVAALLLAGCGLPALTRAVTESADAPAETLSLPDARKGFVTTTRETDPGEAPPTPPAKLFRLVRYESPAGRLAAYVTPNPGDRKRHPAIIWITGGDCNSIDQGVWEPGPEANDQSASAFREAGIVTMFPSLRGGNDNPGRREGFYGEVDDVIAAAKYLERLPHVDPDRIYLGGHSTGGTLVFLVAASTDRFRAVFSFGPTDDVTHYPAQYAPFDRSNPREAELRSPVRWTHSVKSPLFVFEGTSGRGNTEALEAITRASRNPLVKCYPLQGVDHFSLLRPVTKVVAQKILADNGPAPAITFPFPLPELER